ncbi:hypothetical protein L1987_05188 [Smallanthus sonchifolius]|uniref:Uncharacterized protein n=1 Tax=Smallanthus sonchifolius TaxID=185202 RepID=A0ACB9JUR6_9ASTR|nr:hypothetical protein L1987_05188 [Smallanthus sonchifolius]
MADSVSIAMETGSVARKEHLVKTSNGFVSVAIFGDQDKPALVTYPDLALNHTSCFQGLFLCPEAFSLLFHNFCIYHISPPGHELGAAAMSYNFSTLSVDDLADQIAEVLDYFGLDAVMCMGVTAGAYIFTLFAFMANILYYYGMCGLVKELLLIRYFSKVYIPSSLRPDLTEGLKRLQCRSLIFVGENSPFNSDSLHMTSKLDRRFSALVEVLGCGSIVTEEQPDAMLIPLEYFLMGYGLYRPSETNVSPRSPLSPTSISPELYTPESMGLKLKPIKTRFSQI